MIHQRHRWTDGQIDTTCDSKTALCTIVHRTVKKLVIRPRYVVREYEIMMVDDVCVS